MLTITVFFKLTIRLKCKKWIYQTVWILEVMSGRTVLPRKNIFSAQDTGSDEESFDESDSLLTSRGDVAGPSRMNKKPLLPAWIWDLEDDEDLLSSRLGLLEELEIQPRVILSIVLWQLFSPFQSLLARIGILDRNHSADTHPVSLVSSYYRGDIRQYDTSASRTLHGSRSGSGSSRCTHVDFMGPAIVVTAFASLLWLGNQKDVPYVYVIWAMGAAATHFTVRPFLSGSSISFHLSVLGYSLVPAIPMGFVILVYNPSITTSTLIQCASVLWSSFVAIRSYYMVLSPLIEHPSRHKLLLLVPVVLLFELYIIALVPMRRWQINHGEPVKLANF